jgi:hypothetical protein
VPGTAPDREGAQAHSATDARELSQRRDYFARRDKRSRIPMQRVMEFALNPARRESEICRLEWRDNDEQSRTGLVRDAKHPTKKEGNHRRFKHTPEAWALFPAQPGASEYIFPCDPERVETASTRASCTVVDSLVCRSRIHPSDSIGSSLAAWPLSPCELSSTISPLGCPPWSTEHESK